jgi:endonuclease/exonuclease/phosphatase family metal-dependent hydrolase
MTGDGWSPGYPKPEAEKDALRKVILTVKPDVIVFQEMGPGGYLEELRLDLAAEGLDYPYAVVLRAADRERCLAALSRLPIQEKGLNTSLTYTLNGEKQPVKRGLLSLSFLTQGREWTLYTIHLKSRVGTKREQAHLDAERAAEASVVRDNILREQPDGALWILAGDTNDNPSSPARNRLEIKNEKSFDVDLRPVDSKGENWTYYYSKRDTYERIDVMLASPEMAKLVKHDATRIYDGPGSMEASDHRLIYTDVEFR